MRRLRVIPVLLLQEGELVKSVKFKDHQYVGDPINAVRIFNEKEVDEIIILDISATKAKREPNLNQIAELAGEAFMPFAYGGGVTSLQQASEIFYQGAEKVILNASALQEPRLDYTDREKIWVTERRRLNRCGKTVARSPESLWRPRDPEDKVGPSCLR